MPTVKDPVCGMEIAPRKAVGKADYQGKTYYFCSLSCERSFKANPGRYAK